MCSFERVSNANRYERAGRRFGDIVSFRDHEAFVPAEHLSNEIIFADCLFSVAAALPSRMPAYSKMRADLCDEQDNLKLDALCVVLAQASI